MKVATGLVILLSVFAMQFSAHAAKNKEIDFGVDDEQEENFAPAVKAEAPLLDLSWRKSQALEALLNESLKKLVESSGIMPERFRSSVVVLIDPVNPNPKADSKKSNAPVNLALKDAIEFPELKSNPMDFTSLLNQFQSTTVRDSPSRLLASLSNEPKFSVITVSMGVSLDQTAGEDRAKQLEQYIRTAYGSLFGNRLIAQVRSVPLIGPELSFFDRLKQFEKLAWLMLLFAGLACLFLIWKLVPMVRRDPHRFALEAKGLGAFGRRALRDRSSNSNKDADSKTSSSIQLENVHGEIPEKVSEEKKESLEEKIAKIENQIISIVQQHPSLSRILIQDFVTQGMQETTSAEEAKKAENSMLSLSVLLETLAKHKISAEKFIVKTSVRRRFQDMREQISQLTLENRLKMLEEMNWILVSFTFLSDEEGSFSRFHFLETLTDSQIVGLLEKEPPLAQVAMLFGLSEHRTSGVMAQMDSSIRKQIFELMCQGQTLADNDLKSLIERMKEKASSAAQSEGVPSTKKEGIEKIAQFVSQLDFSSEFESVRALFTNAPDLRLMLKGEIFFAALLPEVKSEFLPVIFTDRDADWMSAVIAPFGETFKMKVASVLPPFQQAILQSTSLENVSSAVSMKQLAELQASIRARIENQEISIGEVYDLSKPGLSLVEGGESDSSAQAA